MISVFRMQIDSCDRLWVLDAGIINISTDPKAICPPKILIFDLNSNELLLRYEFPDNIIKQDSLLTNIAVDVRDQCDNAYAYVADVWRYGLLGILTIFSISFFRSGKNLKENNWTYFYRLFFQKYEMLIFLSHTFFKSIRVGQ